MARTDGRASVTHIPRIRKGEIEMAGKAALVIDMTRSMCPIQGALRGPPGRLYQVYNFRYPYRSYG
ncbi:hypothetical protein GCM10027612_03550 [Microbispora bryophytorum subsp. camponoti]